MVVKTVKILKRCIYASVRETTQAVAAFHTRAAAFGAGLGCTAIESFAVASLDIHSFGAAAGIVLPMLMPASAAADLKACASNVVFIHYRPSFLCVLNSILCNKRKNVTKSRKRKTACAVLSEQWLVDSGQKDADFILSIQENSYFFA